MTSKIFPLTLGKLILSSNVIYSSLAGCSDYPFRRIVVPYRPGLFFCEMVKMDALVHYEKETFRFLDYSAEMHPIGAQLCGCNASLAAAAARIIEDLGFNVIDFNCGCPVDKITKDGCGSAMLKHPEAIGEILANMIAAVRIPVTVKVRAGWDANTIKAPLITRIAEEAGAAAITVHGRTRKQGYRGESDWNHIKTCKEAAHCIKVIGNGGVYDAPSGLAMFEKTGCDGILVSRGTLGQPWIAEDIYRLDKGGKIQKRSIEDCRKELLKHFEEMCRYYAPSRVVINMRRIGCWYFKGAERTRVFRREIARAASVEAIRNLIMNFSFEGEDV